MLRRLARHLAVPLAVAASFASCSDYEFAEQDVSLRFDAGEDRIELTIDSRGLFAVPRPLSDDPIPVEEVARDRVRRMAQGERYFHLLTWPLIFELDDHDAPEAGAAPEEPPPGVEEPPMGWAAWAEYQRIVHQSVKVVSAAAYLDEAGEVSIRQTVRIDEAGAVVEFMNGMIGYVVREELGDEEAREKERAKGRSPSPIVMPFESDESRANAWAFLERGEEWITLTEDALTIRVPMTPKDLAGLIRGSMDDAYQVAMRPDTDSASVQQSAALGKALTDGLGALEFDGKVATFTFPAVTPEGDAGEGAEPAVRWHLRGPRSEHAGALGEAFDEGELNPR